MKIEILYFAGCPTYKKAEANVRKALFELHRHAAITLQNIENEQQAIANKFLGSPTVRVNGTDVYPPARESTDYAIKCRIYQTSEGLTGWPDVEMIKKEIASAASSQ